jgi:DNA polymerase III epsilon subunit-like protein
VSREPLTGFRKHDDLVLRAGYAVVDVETTGFCRDGGDLVDGHAIVEIAVVTLDIYGEPIRAWHSLVNPGMPIPRDATEDVHGISDAEVADAPRLPELAGQLWALLAGRLLVCHNAAFDCAFLDEQFPHPSPHREWLDTSLCTLELAKARFPRGQRVALGACCERLGVPHAVAHSALGDALACAGGFRRFLAAGCWPPAWDTKLQAAAAREDPDPANMPSLPARPRRLRGLTTHAGQLSHDQLLALTRLEPAPLPEPPQIEVVVPAPRRDPGPANAHATWTAEQEEQLRGQWLAANPDADADELIAELAAAHGRSPGAIFSRLLKLGYDPENPGTTCTSGRAAALRAARYAAHRR